MTQAQPTQAQKFGFDEDFGNDRRGGVSRRAADAERLKAAELEGFQLGRLDGRREAEAEAAMRLAQAMESVAGTAAGILSQLDAETRRFEREAADLAIAFARKLAGDLLARQPLAPLQEAAAECFRELAGVAHVAVRVPLAHVEDCKTSLEDLAERSGYAGRLVVLGEDGMAEGDFRLEWADGGVLRDRAGVEGLIGEAIARHCNGID